MTIQTSDRQALERGVVDGSLWEAFCDQLRETGRQVQRDEAASSPLDRAEGYRYVARIARIALETFVEFNDPQFPVIYRPCDEIIKMGGDNPDNCYQKCVWMGAVSTVSAAVATRCITSVSSPKVAITARTAPCSAPVSSTVAA